MLHIFILLSWYFLPHLALAIIFFSLVTVIKKFTASYAKLNDTAHLFDTNCSLVFLFLIAISLLYFISSLDLSVILPTQIFFIIYFLFMLSIPYCQSPSC